jgi:hypothetical protein
MCIEFNYTHNPFLITDYFVSLLLRNSKVYLFILLYILLVYICSYDGDMDESMQEQRRVRFGKSQQVCLSFFCYVASLLLPFCGSGQKIQTRVRNTFSILNI